MHIYDSFLKWHVWIFPRVRFVVFKWAIGVALRDYSIAVLVSFAPLGIGWGRTD